MFTIDTEDQFNLLLETLSQSEVVNNAINEVIIDNQAPLDNQDPLQDVIDKIFMDNHFPLDHQVPLDNQAPLDLTVKRESEDLQCPVASPP